MSKSDKKVEEITQEIIDYKKLAETEKLIKNNVIQDKQKDLETQENTKSKLLQDNEEHTTKKMALTRNHGQILMTIDNLYQKLLKNCEKLLF